MIIKLNKNNINERWVQYIWKNIYLIPKYLIFELRIGGSVMGAAMALHKWLK